MKKILLCLLLAFGFQNLALAQELNLFQETENPAQQQNKTAARTPRKSSENSGPAFTLQSTSRFGNTYKAGLVSKDGVEVSVEWKQGSASPIEGHRGYRLLSVGSRTASVRLPDDEPCVESQQQGVKCSNGIAQLTLTNGAPIVRKEPPAKEPASTEEKSTAAINNPFSGQPQTAPAISDEEAKLRRDRRIERAKSLRNFEIVRIADEDVPPGMRVVRTPFGDRLVPEGEEE